MKVAALFPVGTSSGGCIAAIREILAREESVDVYLLHGILADGQQAPDPADIAVDIAATSDFGGRAAFRSIEPIQTFDLSSAYRTARATVRRMASEHYSRVYVGITGGANPLVASVFHTAMTYLATEVVPIYAQGQGTQTERTFVAPDIRLEMLAEEAVNTARSGQMRVAAQLAARLPDTGEWSFARESLAALGAWDDFDYAKARDILRRQMRHCAAHQSHPMFSGLADAVERLAAVADRMVNITKEFREVGRFEKLAAASDWPSRARECGGLLVADALANAKRRLQEGRYTDSVLRSYRAAECATQVRLYEIGIHPSKPAASRTAFERVSGIIDGEKNLAFRAGLDLLCQIGEITYEGISMNVNALGPMRNSTYLEHGYTRVEQHQAEQCLEHALIICRCLLGQEAVANWPDLSMRL